MSPASPPPVLLPYQRRWIDDPAPVKVWTKSRRIGATWAEASDDVLIAATDPGHGGQNVSYVGSGREMAREFVDACGDWVRWLGRAADEAREVMVADEDREILSYRIDFASGSHILALSSRPSNLRGRKGVVVIDEAAFQDRLDDVVQAATPLLMWGGKVRVISSHNGQSPFLAYERDILAGRRRWTLHRTTLDDAIGDGLHRRICRVRGLEWSPGAEAEWRRELIESAPTREAADEEYFCIPRSGGGVYLGRALLESRAVRAPVRRLVRTDADNARAEHVRLRDARAWCEREIGPVLQALDPRRQHAAGEDFGRTADLTVLQALEIGQGLQRSPVLQVEMRNVPFAEQELVVTWVLDRLPRLRRVELDARGNGQYLAEQCVNRYGSRAEAVMISRAWYAEHMPRMKAALETGELSVPADDDTIEDYLALRVVDGVPMVPRTRTGANADRHGDAAVAGCLAYAASRGETPEYGWTPVPRGGPARDPWGDPAEDMDARPLGRSAGFARMRGNLL